MYPFGQANVPLGVHVPQVGNHWSTPNRLRYVDFSYKCINEFFVYLNTMKGTN